MAPPDLYSTAAYYAPGLADTDRLVTAAHAALNAGVYSHSLGELATVRPPTWADCHPLFVAAMRELGVDLPDPAAAVRAVVDHYATRLAEGVVSPEAGLRALHSFELRLRYDSPTMPPTDVLAPLGPFIGLYYAVEEERGYEEYRSATGVTRPDGPAPDDLSTRCLALARDWCRGRWGSSVDACPRTAAVVGLARGIDADRGWDRLPILADALEEAGCDAADLLAHCRAGSEHLERCWAVDLVLGRE